MIKNKSILDLECALDDGIILVASDIHFPFQDDKAIDTFLLYAEGCQPDMVVLNGDLLDFYKLSRFSKDPSGRDPEEEIVMCRDFLTKLRAVVPDAHIYYCIGNHETRLEKYVIDNAPMISGLMRNVFEVLDLNKYNIQGCGKLTVNDTFVFRHGNLLGSKCGLSAIKELEAHYTSGATGHTHRLARYSTRKSGRRFIWLETGCLCDLNPSYMNNADWEQGFGRVAFRNGKLILADVVAINEQGEIVGG